MYKDIKRIVDIMISLVVIVLASPLFLLTVLLLSWVNGGSPFFTQMRPGRFDIPFKLLKFKTMNDKCNDSGELLDDAQRLTAIGRIVRKLSLDELPQLFNVLKGDMSLIGPRPLLMDYLPLYNEQQKRRHEIKPGITGWAQVNGRNANSWKKKFELDVWYVDNCSFTLDCKILLLTVIKVLQSDGINSKTASTMEKFKGTT